MKQLKRGDLVWHNYTAVKRYLMIVLECRYKTDVYLCQDVKNGSMEYWLSGERLQDVE